MKPIRDLFKPVFFAAGILALTFNVVGCGGGWAGGHPPGGGVGWVPGGGNPADPGRPPDGMIEPISQPVRCDGRVVFLDARNRLSGLANIKVIARNAAGDRVSSALTGPDGRYSLLLERQQLNLIEASYRGYTFSPDVIRFSPRGPENIPLIEGRRLVLNLPGANASVSDPVGLGWAGRRLRLPD